MNKSVTDWFIFFILSLIWGSSFILMKLGLQQLSSYQVAALRIFSAGVVLLPVTIKFIRQIPLKQLFLVFLSGSIGNLIPAFLFCIAEEKIDSGLAGTLNSLTPVFVIVTGSVFFNIPTSINKITGIFIAFTGSVLLLISSSGLQKDLHLSLTFLVVLATFLYGFNVNMITKKLSNLPSLHIVSVALSLNALVALLVLIFTGYFRMPLGSKEMLVATGASVVLGVFGTALATIIFYMLVKTAGGVFATMVTYAIPFVALGWGLVYGENIGWKEGVCMLIILTGVYYANKKVKAPVT